MNFKQALAHDAHNVFCNPDEFGEEITIDGITVIGIWDDTAKTLTNGQNLSGVADVNVFGLLADERTLYVPTAECGDGIPTPVVNQRLDIDGDYWTVLPGSRAKHGLLELKLSRVFS